jgi:hypothetical protein
VSAGVRGWPRGITGMSGFDVRIHAIRRRPDRRRPFEVRWHAAGRARSRSFITRGLADSYRAELIRAARKGLDFSPGTGEPVSWAAPEAATISWLEHAAAYAAMKWPLAAAPGPRSGQSRAARRLRPTTCPLRGPGGCGRRPRRGRRARFRTGPGPAPMGGGRSQISLPSYLGPTASGAATQDSHESPPGEGIEVRRRP